MPAAPTRSASMAFRSSAVARTRWRRLLEGRVPFGNHAEAELGTVGLSRMVANFMEGSDRLRARSVAVHNDSGVSVKILKELVRCNDGRERKLLKETSRLVGGEPDVGGHGDQEVRARVRDGLWSLGFNASVCISKWNQTFRYPPGQHEYIDVVIEEPNPCTPAAAAENRIIIDVDFRSEFEVARCTRHYAAILRNLPEVFVGRPDRLRRLVTVVSDAAVKSLRRSGMHVPPWRRPEYMLRKWFSPYVRRGRPGRPPRASPSPVAEFVLDHQVGEEEVDDEEEEEEDEEEWEEDEEEEEDEEREWRTPAFPPRVRRGRVGAWALA